MISPTRLGVAVAAAFMLVLVALSVPAQAVAPVAIALAAFAAGAIAGALMSPFRTAASQAELAKQQYAQDAGTYASTLEGIYSQYYANSLSMIYDMHNMLFNKTFTYYVRWAESIASSKCASKSTSTPTITYQDIAPVAQDLAQIYANYLQQMLNIFINTYQNAVGVAMIRHQAGIGDYAHILFGDASGFDVDYNGSIYIAAQNLGKLTQASAIIISNGKRYVVATGSTSGVSADQAAIVGLLNPENKIDGVDFVVNGTMGSAPYLLPFENILWTIRDFKYIAGAAFANAQLYCNLVAAGTAAANIPPPSVALPFDLNTYNQLSPEDRYALYISYLNRLAQTDWSQVSSVLPKDVYISNTSGRVSGTVCLDFNPNNCQNYVVVPVTPTIAINFSVGGYAPLAGTYALVDPQTGRIVNIINPSPLPVPQDYSTLWSNGRQALINWADPNTGQTYQGVAVDVDGDGRYDEVYPYIQPSQIYQRDPRTGSVSSVNNIVIGPTPTDQWASSYGLDKPQPLSFLGGLSGLPSWALWAAIGFGALLLLIVALRR